MANTQHRSDDRAREERLSEAADLARTATELPGVADLLSLYERHADLVHRANAYLKPRSTTLILTSSDATAPTCPRTPTTSAVATPAPAAS
jgi:hypothetical protein